MIVFALVSSYFSLVDSRALCSGNAWPRASEDYYFQGVSWTTHAGIPLAGDAGSFNAGTRLFLRIYDALFRASVFKSRAELGGDEAMEMGLVYPILDSILVSGALQTSYSYGEGRYVPGFSLRMGAYWVGPRGDIGVGLNLARMEALSVIAEMNNRPMDNLIWGFSYAGGMKRSNIATSVRFGQKWGFSLGGGATWLTDSNKVLLWPGLGLDYDGRKMAWNLSLRYDGLYGEYHPIIDFGFTYKRPYIKTDTAQAPAVAVSLPDTAGKGLVSNEENNGTKPTGKTDPKITKPNSPPKDGTSGSAATGPKATAEDIEILYLKGVEAYRWEDFATAIYYWEQVLALDPNHEKAKRGIERAKKYLGK
ncbi:MAG: hypothetical protein ABIN58_04335 [candidate division WOR-3 bacterium]